MVKKEILFSVTSADLEWEFIRGSGKGGQNRNKRDTACRCTHRPSGAVGYAEDERQQRQNRKIAFKRMAKSKKFQDWIRLEASRKTGELAKIEEKIERELQTRVKTEIHDEQGRWIEVREIPNEN